MKDEILIQKELNTQCLEPFGVSSGGCISKGSGYITDFGKIFLKLNNKPKAKIMLDGEYSSLKAIHSTNTIRCPKPYKDFKSDETNVCYLAVEYIDIQRSKNQDKLGGKLANLHNYNLEVKALSPHKYIDKFGFSKPTCCGYIPQENTWNSDWIDFFINQRLQFQMDLIEKEYKDNEAKKLWETLKPMIPSYFNIDIFPSLLHGDLWSGNIGETIDGEPVIFDPASFYGHHEYDLGIAKMFGGFSSSFYSAYHKIMPKTEGFEERNQLYQLFHYLNHWNHFGVGYKSSAISIMRNFIK